MSAAASPPHPPEPLKPLKAEGVNASDVTPWFDGGHPGLLTIPQQPDAPSSSPEPLPGLVPAAASNGAAPANTQLEPQGLPTEYGLPLDCKPHEKERWERQERYLAAWVKQGNHTRACQSTGISRHTSIYWEEQNVLGFNQRLKLAQERHRELLEEEHVLAPLRAASARDKLLHPVLPIFALKGAWPDKYGDKVQVQDNQGVVTLLRHMSQLAKERQKQLPVAEGQVVELPATEPDAPS